MKIYKYIICYFFLCCVSCVEPYIPPKIDGEGFLVVNGHAFVESKSCMIQLTRTQNIGSRDKAQPEIGAKVWLEDEFSNIFNLSENNNTGEYAFNNLLLNYNVKYRINIKTKGGNEYQSTFNAAYSPPMIEKINFEPGELDEFEFKKNWNINIDAKNSNNSNKFYRIQFVETWEYRSLNFSDVYFVNDNGLTQIIKRDSPIDKIDKCWKSDSSKLILTYSTENLTENLISKFQINQVDVTTKKLNYNYSILTKITAISKEEYLYWEALKKNSQSTGSIFDPQPAQITGNIINMKDKNDLVLGFFSPYSYSQKRETKSNIQLERTKMVSLSQCPESPIEFNDLVRTFNQGYLIRQRFDPLTKLLVGYFIIQPACADCREVDPKGTNLKPSFFP